jgi:outer membrane protein assembly factor BamB
MSTVAIHDGLVYAAEPWGKIHCLDAKTGHVHWIYETRNEIWGSPLVADGKLYIGSGKSLFVLVAGSEKRLISEVKLSFDVATAPAAANETVFVASQRNLWAIRITDRSKP